jgi:hypothetical protein
VDLRQQRVAKNEILFREVNERIKDVSAELESEEPTDFLCECGSESCTQPISLTLSEYEDVRQEATSFAIVPGHEVDDVETVVGQNERFAVVEKDTPVAARMATEQDPRA